MSKLLTTYIVLYVDVLTSINKQGLVCYFDS